MKYINNHMTTNQRARTAVAFAGILAASSVSAQTWTGTTGNWEDAANWDSIAYPLNLADNSSTLSEIKVGVFNADSSAVDVTISSAIGTADTVPNTTLNVRSGASLTLASTASISRSAARIINFSVNTQAYGDTTFTMNAGSSAELQSFALNRFGSGTGTSSATAVIDGAELNVGLGFNFSFNGVKNAALLDVKNAAVVTVGQGVAFASTNATGPELNEVRIASGSSFQANGAVAVSGVTATQNINAKVSLIGSDNTVSSGSISMLHDAPTTGSHSMEFDFTADAAGLQNFAVTNNIDFDSDAWVDLSVDVTAGPDGLNSFDLFTYGGTLAGEFGSIAAVDGASSLVLASAGDNVQIGEYWIDYGTGSADSITFTYNAVPEVSSYALFAGFLGLTWVMVRRRQ